MEVFIQQSNQLLGADGAGIEVALHFVATGVDEKSQLFAGFYAFGDDFVLELLGHHDNGAGDGAVVLVRRDVEDEGAVYL